MAPLIFTACDVYCLHQRWPLRTRAAQLLLRQSGSSRRRSVLRSVPQNCGASARTGLHRCGRQKGSQYGTRRPVFRHCGAGEVRRCSAWRVLAASSQLAHARVICCSMAHLPAEHPLRNGGIVSLSAAAPAARRCWCSLLLGGGVALPTAPRNLPCCVNTLA
jgi:hypothetical protein